MESRGNLITFLILGVCLFGAGDVQAARVLGMFPFSSSSQRNIFGTLTRELAARGHHLTVVTPHPIDSPPGNYTQINVARAVTPHYEPYNQTRVIKATEVLWKLLNTTTRVCEDVLALPEMRQLMDPKESGRGFDLMLTSSMFCDCYFPFAHVYDVPVIVISPSGPLPDTDALVGNVALTSFVPNIFLSFTDRMNFVERTVNFASTLIYKFFVEFILHPRYERITRVHFGDHPPLSVLQRRTSLVLLNIHFSYGYPRPLTPNVIEIGGIHINPPNPLPKNLQEYLDDSKDGVILFSMGTTVKSVCFPVEKRDAIFGAFSELKQSVLMKWEGDRPLPGQTPNIRLEKWLPQSDVLAHPNVKLFVTHGGLLSFQEAVARGIPIVGIPFFGDQEQNMKKVAHMGVGVRVCYKELNKETFLGAMKKVLEDQSFRENMRKLTAQAMDQPEHPLQKAVFWIEYVIRHKGAKHIQPASLDLWWFQLYSVDVIAFLVSIPVVFFIGIWYSVKVFCRRRSCGNGEVQRKKKETSKEH